MVLWGQAVSKKTIMSRLYVSLAEKLFGKGLAVSKKSR
jgi:hypothetical protein